MKAPTTVKGTSNESTNKCEEIIRTTFVSCMESGCEVSFKGMPQIRSTESFEEITELCYVTGLN